MGEGAGMTGHHRLDDIGRDALRDAAPDIITSFRGPHNRKISTRKALRWGRHGSLSLVIAGSKAGCWFDHEQGRGGDIIEFIKDERRCSFREALDYAADFVSELRRSPQPRPTPQPTVDDTDYEDEERIANAVEIWCQARQLKGTLAETYLRSRGINVPVETLSALRFHSRCPWQGGTRPALVGLICDALTDEPTGIQRIALSAAGHKIAPKALGCKADGAVKLSLDITTELTIGEGIETSLSAMMFGFGPAWSVIDAGEMSKFPVLPEVERLTIIVDNDISGTGQRAAAQCKARWLAAGRRVRTVMSSRPGDDLNDILQRREKQLSGASNVVDLIRARSRRHG
jgi:putative DNA primase/helicase